MNADRSPSIPPEHIPTGRPLHEMLLAHYRQMPGWHRRVMMFAAVLMVLGILGTIRSVTTPDAISLKGTTPQTNQQPPPGSGFVSDSSHAAAAKTPDAAPSVPWYLSPHLLAVGISTIGGFVIGFAMRAFVKTVTVALAAIGGMIATLSYLRFFNVDFSAAHQEFATAAAWFNSQIGLLKDAAIAHLPSHLGAAVGAFIGFRRR